VDESRILIVTDAVVQVLDRNTRAPVGSASLPPVAAAPAVSGGWVYVPSTNGQLYAFRAN
jgi:outer membrane protein assembly factor BamB